MRHRVLVVAQDVMLRSTLARWLMSAGYIVELAESERRAGEVFANHKVALTLLAPGRSGGPALDLADTGGKLIVVAEQSHDGAPAGRWIPLGTARRAEGAGLCKVCPADAARR